MKLISTFGALCTAALISVSACESTGMQLGGGDSFSSTGDGGNNPVLKQCDTPVGTAALIEDDYSVLRQLGFESPIQTIRIMMMESNCFQVVDRGAASDAMMRERALMDQGELQGGSDMGGGQMVAADYLITPTVSTANSNAGGSSIGGIVGGMVGGTLGAVASNISLNSKTANVTLFATDTRSGVQVAASQGSAKKSDLGFGAAAGGYWGSFAGVGGSTYTNTELGKIIIAAFVDAHNKLVDQVQ